MPEVKEAKKVRKVQTAAEAKLGLARKVGVALQKLDTLARLRYEGLQEDDAAKIKESIGRKVSDLEAHLDVLVRTGGKKDKRQKIDFVL